MIFSEFITIAISALLTNKLRSLLTVLSITIGIAAVLSIFIFVSYYIITFHFHGENTSRFCEPSLRLPRKFPP